MKVRLQRIPPLQAAKVVAVLYGCLSLVFVPFILLFVLASASAQPEEAGITAGVSIAMMIFMPVMYMIGGFIGALIGAFVYNQVAKWVGGFEFHFEGVEVES